MAKPARQYWLMKSEPDAFSIADLEKKGTAPWDGVRAYAARSNMDAMQLGDLVLFYHSSCVPPGAVGIASVAKLAYPDPTQFDPKSQYFDAKSKPDAPRWRMVDVTYVSTFPRMVTLEAMREDPELAEMVVVKPGRLSVQPVTKDEFARVVKLGGGKVPK
jgi:predicted RNA-binding protein with PUA-like domain